MYKGRRISVVVPAYNEAAHIADVVKSMPEYIDHILVVDDSSRDNTHEAAQATSLQNLKIYRTEANQGVGGATLLGFAKALELESDVILKMDGDGQMPPQYISALLDAVLEEGYDYAKGNRFLAGESLAFMPRHRLLGNVALTFLTKLASGYWHIYDPQNGYVAIKSSALKNLKFKDIHRGYFFENDMLVQLNLFGLKVKDVPIPAFYGNERSDLDPLKVGFTFPFLLVRRFIRRIYQKYILRDFSPIALFLILGSMLFGWGGVFGLYLWYKTWQTGLASPTGTIMLSLLPLILGFQLLLQAIVLDIKETPR